MSTRGSIAKYTSNWPVSDRGRDRVDGGRVGESRSYPASHVHSCEHASEHVTGYVAFIIRDCICNIDDKLYDCVLHADVDGLEVPRLKEMMHGAVEKVHGNIDIEKAADQIRYECDIRLRYREGYAWIAEVSSIVRVCGRGDE